MNIEQALELADQLLYERTGKYLSDLERKVFLGSWQGQTYEEIYPNNPQYLEKDVGYKLWKKLSLAIGERVTKKNLQGAMNRLWQNIQQNQHSAKSIGFRTTQTSLFSLWILQPEHPDHALIAQDVCKTMQALGIKANCVDKHLFPLERCSLPNVGEHQLFCTIKLQFPGE